ncbi:MAG: 50S ribosomal protein L22 [Candidatus Cloacimonetes bacterium HGW-Cloacimonetes-2]|jgi:large subunit ribosomal protein L22|nr:MAG: 50S ribosomal protein L22 [Candidatus Cloacimonetes bacterium HGW-Cloacimonetes-2]
MEATAKLRFVRGSARKARLVLDQIRGRQVTEAQNILKFSRRRAAGQIGKLLASAIANAQVKEPKIDLTNVFVAVAMADEGPAMKRFMPRAQGRAFMIRRPTCHITLEIHSN